MRTNVEYRVRVEHVTRLVAAIIAAEVTGSEYGHQDKNNEYDVRRAQDLYDEILKQSKERASGKVEGD